MAQTTRTDVKPSTPEFWNAISINALRGNTVLPQLIRTDLSNDIADVGDTVNISKRGSVTAREKAEDTAITTDGPSTTKVAVSLDTHLYVAWKLEDSAGSVAISNAIRNVETGIIAIAERIESDIAALHSEIATEVGTAGTDINKATLLAARKALNDQKSPQTGRNLIVSTKDDVALLGIEHFTGANTRDMEGLRALREASIGRLFGFDVYMSQYVDVTAGAPDTTHNMAFHEDAFALVSRPLILPPERAGAQAMIFMDPVTGIAMRYTKQWDVNHLATVHVIDVLYGVKAIDEDRLAVEVIS